jgi:glycerol-3-phosphate dehydrogenase
MIMSNAASGETPVSQGRSSSNPRRLSILDREETIECESLINPEILKGGALYYEYRTDDSRLTMEVIKKAAEHGAVVINYVEATDFIYHKLRVQGVEVKGSPRNNLERCRFE